MAAKKIVRFFLGLFRFSRKVKGDKPVVWE